MKVTVAIFSKNDFDAVDSRFDKSEPRTEHAGWVSPDLSWFEVRPGSVRKGFLKRMRVKRALLRLKKIRLTVSVK